MYSVKKALKKSIKNTIDSRKLKRVFHFYSAQFKSYLAINGYPNITIDGENNYIEKWKVFGHEVEPYSYRLYSHYMEPSSDIVPENIGRMHIEPILNPAPMRAYYADKNVFPVVCGEENVPKTLLCRINGSTLLDGKFVPVNCDIDDLLQEEQRVVLKPSVDGSSGKGVMMFTKKDGKWVSSSDAAVLTSDYLMKYGKDFVLQRAITQHEDLSYFNPSSVNTIRLAVYRSVKDEVPHVTAGVMRVGRSGEYVDNAHRGGGVFVGIDMSTGRVGNKLFNHCGQCQTEWNGLDYSEERYIPNWEEVKQFACQIARKVTHHRLLALDLTVTSEGRPFLIEYNLKAFSYWFFMFTNQKPFGEFTDEIIEYCRDKSSL